MERVIGSYEVIDELGRGGMGVVYRARHLPTGALRALKVMTGRADPAALARFRREAEALARVGGEGTVPVHEAGTDRGRLFLVLGLMPGGTLRARLHARGRLPWREAATLVATLARALEACHAAGLVHRDLKPDNVLFDDQDRPRLADFGCVRDLASVSLTETGAMLGTPVYAAPEQLNGLKADHRADVYALGVVLHELVAGRPPFDGKNVLNILFAKTQSERPRLAGATDAPPALDAVLDRALDPDPAARTPSAAALARALDAVLEGRSPGGASRRSSFRLVAAVLVVGVVAVSVALLTRARPPVETPPPPGGAGGRPSAPPKAPPPAPHVAPTAAAVEDALRLGKPLEPVLAALDASAPLVLDERDRAKVRLAIRARMREESGRVSSAALAMRYVPARAALAAFVIGTKLGIDDERELLATVLHDADEGPEPFDRALVVLAGRAVPRVPEAAHAFAKLVQSHVGHLSSEDEAVLERALEASVAAAPEDPMLRLVRGMQRVQAAIRARSAVHEGALEDLELAHRGGLVLSSNASVAAGYLAWVHERCGRTREALTVIAEGRHQRLKGDFLDHAFTVLVEIRAFLREGEPARALAIVAAAGGKFPTVARLRPRIESAGSDEKRLSALADELRDATE